MVLIFESFDEILWYDHKNKVSLTILSHGFICQHFYKMKFGSFIAVRSLTFITFGDDRVKDIWNSCWIHRCKEYSTAVQIKKTILIPGTKREDQSRQSDPEWLHHTLRQ